MNKNHFCVPLKLTPLPFRKEVIHLFKDRIRALLFRHPYILLGVSNGAFEHTKQLGQLGIGNLGQHIENPLKGYISIHWLWATPSKKSPPRSITCALRPRPIFRGVCWFLECLFLGSQPLRYVQITFPGGATLQKNARNFLRYTGGTGGRSKYRTSPLHALCWIDPVDSSPFGDSAVLGTSRRVSMPRGEPNECRAIWLIHVRVLT